MRNQYKAFQEAGVEVVALAVASPSAVDSARKTTGATYPMLADPQHEAADAYGVYNLLNDKLAAPAVFIIAANGDIVWHYVGKNRNDRPSPQKILEHLP